MERIFQILAGVFAVAAGYFYWQDSIDLMFAAAVLGAVSFFLSIRFKVKERLKQREWEREDAEVLPE